MIILVMSDTHDIKNGVIKEICEEGKRRGASSIIHCGDLSPEHQDAELFGGLPVICALVDGQETDSVFEEKKPDGWKYTLPGKRIVKLPDGTIVYIGHKKHMDFLKATEEQFTAILTDLRQSFDGLRIVFGGHLHFQTYKQGQLVSFINPGAVKDAMSWGYEYAVIDTATGQVIFSRILPTPDDRSVFSVGVISDSLDITHRDSAYWRRLAKEFHDRGVSHIIHCGNLSLSDIGREELSGFSVHYAIRADQKFEYSKLVKAETIPKNWEAIADKDLDKGAIVNINGYHFFVQLDLGLEFQTVSELAMDTMAMHIRRQYPETEFLLCGFTREALYVEGQQVTIINPGDVNNSRNFAVICLPRREITFGRVPFDVLPTT